MLSQIFASVRREGRKFLLEQEAKAVCMEYGVPVTKFRVAKTTDEAVKFAEKIGYPVVLKIVSPDVIHKFDVGGVFLNLEGPEQVRKAFNQILENVKRRKPEAKIMASMCKRWCRLQLK